MVVKNAYEKCGLTEEQYRRFKSACRSTYQTIGADLGPIKGTDLREVIVDADYLLMYGERGRGRTGTPIDWETFYKTIISPMITKNFDTAPFKAMMKDIFPFKMYD